MLKKSFVISLCLMFLFTYTFVPEASARQRRGGSDSSDIITGAAIFAGVILVIGIVGGMILSSKKETKKLDQKTNVEIKQDKMFGKDSAAEEQDYSEGESDIGNIALSSIRF